MVNSLEQLKDTALKTSPSIGMTPKFYTLHMSKTKKQVIKPAESFLWNSEAFVASTSDQVVDMKSFLQSCVRYERPTANGGITFGNQVHHQADGAPFDPYGTLFLPVVELKTGRDWEKKCKLIGFNNDDRLQFLKVLLGVVVGKVPMEFGRASNSYRDSSSVVSPWFCAFRSAGSQPQSSMTSTESEVSSLYSGLLK